MYYPNFGSVRTVSFTCDVYTNDSLHGVCFPAVVIMEDYADSVNAPIIHQSRKSVKK